MKKILYTLTLSTLFGYATPAMPGMQTLSNGDGSTFQAELKGDPWFHYTQDSSGKIAIFNAGSGDFEYADYNSSAHKLTPSGVKAGMPPGTHGSISLINLSNAWQSAKAALPSNPSPIALLVGGQTLYEVQPAHEGMPKQLYKLSINGDTTSMKIEKILPPSSQLKVNTLQISGQRLLNMQAHPQPPSYWMLSQKSGYIEAKSYLYVNAYFMNYTGRWYANQADATSYYNAL